VSLRQSFPQDGRLLFVVDTTTSTNDLAREWGRQGAPDGATVMADRQTSGRGRSGRHWHSPPGMNLYLSRIIRDTPSNLRLAPLVGAVATCAAVEKHLPGFRVSIKWPNDVLADGRKLAGILAELETGPEPFAVIGIGLNVNMQAADFPTGLRTPATSLRIELGRPLRRAALQENLTEQLAAWCNQLGRDPGRIVEAYTCRCTTLGNRVRVTPPGRPAFTGRALRIAPDGALWVERDDRQQVRIEAGDVDTCA